MLQFSLYQYLSPDEISECYSEAVGRVEQQLKDIKPGNCASYSFGATGDLNTRTKDQRIDDAYIGTLAECIGAKFMKTVWTKERLQYTGTNKPDLYVKVLNRRIRAEARGSRKPIAIFRPYWQNGSPRDFHSSKKNDILFAVANLSTTQQTEFFCGWKSFGRLRELCEANPTWLKAKDSPSPFYMIPIQYFDHGDIFTKTDQTFLESYVD